MGEWLVYLLPQYSNDAASGICGFSNVILTIWITTDRLLNNPWAQPPLPIDWEVHPTYSRKPVPYYLAPLWDANLATRNAADKKKRDMSRKPTTEEESHVIVAKELKQKLKKAKAAKGLLQDLEEEVRGFVKKWEEKAKKLEQEGLHDLDSEDEEIVFVGRNGQMNDMPSSPKSKGSTQEEEIKRDKLVFDSLADDHGASFGYFFLLLRFEIMHKINHLRRRWLVHSIATYYDLRTWSVTVGDPARREAYVGIKRVESSSRRLSFGGGLPRPLWGMV